MNALHIASERRLQVKTFGDLLTGHHRVVMALIQQNNGRSYEKRGYGLTCWLRRYASVEVTEQPSACNQRHYSAVHGDFALAIVAVEG